MPGSALGTSSGRLGRLLEGVAVATPCESFNVLRSTARLLEHVRELVAEQRLALPREGVEFPLAEVRRRPKHSCLRQTKSRETG